MGNLPQQNRHWPASVQQEYCDLCGRKIPAAERVQGDSQGLYQRWLCPECAPLGLNPSYIDYGGPGNQAPLPEAPEPHSGDDWETNTQGEIVYSEFYAGTEDPQAAPTNGGAGVSNVRVVGIPFTLPRQIIGNTATTLTLFVRSIGVAPCVIEAALYQQTSNLVTPGTFVSDLGSATTMAGADATFSMNIDLSGDTIYFLVYRSNGICSTPGFAASYGNDILGDGMILLRKPWSNTEFAYGLPWPATCGTIPWTRTGSPVELPAFRITLEA